MKKNRKNNIIADSPNSSKKQIFENKGSLSKLYQQILKDRTAESQSSLMEMNMDLNKEKFKSILFKVPFRSPETLGANVIDMTKDELSHLLKNNPKWGGRTEVEILLSLSESDFSGYSYLKIGQKMIQELLDRMNHNFGLYIQEHLYYEDCTILESQVSGVREILNTLVGGDKGPIKTFKEPKIKEVFKDASVDKKDAEVVIRALNEVCSLIPDKYKKNVPPVTVLIRQGGPGQVSIASLDKSILVLNVRNNKVLQAAEAFHEYVHLIERFNKKLMKGSNDFLKSRRVDAQKRTLKEICEKYNKHFRPDAGSIEVYEDHFMDAYAGRVYGDLDGPTPVPTEVLTVGCEVMMLDPIGFAVKDRDYFNFIARFLKGQI
jgi:hypothetical protein